MQLFSVFNSLQFLTSDTSLIWIYNRIKVQNNLLVWGVVSAYIFLCTQIHTHTNLNGAITLLTAQFKSYLYCFGDIRCMYEADISVTFLWFVVYWHSCLESMCPNMTTDRQLYLQNTHTLQMFVSDTKFKLACVPSKWPFSMPSIPELQPWYRTQKITDAWFLLDRVYNLSANRYRNKV